MDAVDGTGGKIHILQLCAVKICPGAVRIAQNHSFGLCFGESSFPQLHLLHPHPLQNCLRKRGIAQGSIRNGGLLPVGGAEIGPVPGAVLQAAVPPIAVTKPAGRKIAVFKDTAVEAGLIKAAARKPAVPEADGFEFHPAKIQFFRSFPHKFHIFNIQIFFILRFLQPLCQHGHTLFPIFGDIVPQNTPYDKSCEKLAILRKSGILDLKITRRFLMKRYDVKAYAACARKMVAEGSVLLRNEAGALPFGNQERVAVFGRSQFNYYKSGTGSGGLVNTAPVVGITDALEQSGAVTVDAGLKAVYESWIAVHPFDAGQGWASGPWFQEEMPLEDTLVAQVRSRNDAAVVIIGRTAGEDQDNSNAEGSYQLTAAEKDMLSKVCTAFDRVAVVLNTGNIIDMQWVEEYKPAAVLYVWQGGQEGGFGTADVLTGAAAPGGRLSDTIARSITDYPAHGNFGSDHCNIYAEDIYVGYRYFETFAKNCVLFPFGFGLTYTTFERDVISASEKDGTATVAVSVTNTGKAAGREVIQLYCQAPQGKLGKAARVLCGFAKTGCLQPGESETVSISCRLDQLVSFDDSGVTGHPNAWVLEGGSYTFCCGTDVRCAAPVLTVEVSEAVVEQVEEACAPVTAFDRLRPVCENGVFVKAYEPTPLQTVDPNVRRMERLPAAAPCAGDLGITLSDVAQGKADMDTFLSQLTDEDLMVIVRGEGMCSPRVTPGTAGAFGGVSDRLVKKFGIPTACCSDGPSGIRMDCGTRAFAMPNGTCQACSFDTELVGELYEYAGLELRKNKIDTLLGPGINIHRHPLNGRNFEYFSEDPLLTGLMAAAQLKAMHKYKVTGTMKHFACNSQEYRRHDVDSVVSQRALREIYLKAFEIAVKEGNARSIMSSYNPVNGIWTSGNYDLLTTIARKEWGFTGIVMSDWWPKANDYAGGPGERSNMAPQVRAQNDLYMVTPCPAENTNNDNSAQALAAGTVTRAEFLRNAANICRVILTFPCMDRAMGIRTELDEELDKAPSFDGDNVAPMYIAEPDEDNPKHIQVDVSKIGLKKGDTTQFTIALKEAGLYHMHLTLRSEDSNDVSQLPISVFRDRELVQTITLNGSQRDWQTFELEVGGMNTFYLRFYVGQEGLGVKECDMEHFMTMAELHAMLDQRKRENQVKPE